jgi:putative transposase-like DNA-binding protein
MPLIVRKYGLLRPLNWGDDCFDHLYLQNKLWNRLVEIEQDNRNRYRAIVGSIEVAATIQTTIETVKKRIEEMDFQRKQLRMQHYKKIGIHTESLDVAIKAAKEELKDLASKAKEFRISAKESIKELTAHLEPERKEAIKQARQASGLWWGNYNAVVDSYETARLRASKEGAELKFHRFDGAGRFTCQIQGGMSTDNLLSGRKNIAQLQMISSGEFRAVIKSSPPATQLQSVGSRRDKREYAILTITVYTGQDEQGKKTRRTLEFPIILHRPLPESAILKMLVVNRRKVGTDFTWSVTFTFASENNEAVEHPSVCSCGINLGWKRVEGGLRVGTICDGTETRHIVLPQAIIDKFAYSEELQSSIDKTTNENYAWLLDKMTTPPEVLAEDVALLRRAKRPNPVKFAHFVIKWRNECPEFQPHVLTDAENMRKKVKRLYLEFHHIRDKVLRRRLDFYRNEAKKVCEKYNLIRLDKFDLRQMAVLEKGDGRPNELPNVARYHQKIAAVSELREWIGKQALKTGSKIEMIAMESTRTCHVCGGIMVPSDGLMRRCRDCGTLHDTDANAAANLNQVVV